MSYGGRMTCTENHFFHARCVDCTARYLSTMSLDEVDNYFTQGIVNRDAYDAYKHVWSLSATRSEAYDHYKRIPETEQAREYAEVLKDILRTKGLDI